MKDNLFEMLLNLFERSLTQLQKSQIEVDANSELLNDLTPAIEEPALHIKSAEPNSTRIFTYQEKMKMTKASYQFLMRMQQWSMIDTDTLESVLHQMHCSDSRIIILQETKWIIRNVLASTLNEEQLAFLDLVLYQTEDNLTTH